VVSDNAFGGKLPLMLDLRFASGQRRSFDLYFWTISHGGVSRQQHEFRIQLTLPKAEQIERMRGTVLLLGYYEGVDARFVDVPSGNNAGEVFVAWDPLLHIRTGKSASCQVPFAALREAQLHGLGTHVRRCAAGVETIIAMRSTRLPAYLRLARAGHNSVDPVELGSALD
jgi:hypothetical protein